MAATKSQGQFSQSSMRLLDIIECLAEATGAMRLQEIARKTGISQPTVLRYLSSLEAANYVYKDDDTHRYALTWRIRSLSRQKVRPPVSLIYCRRCIRCSICFPACSGSRRRRCSFRRNGILCRSSIPCRLCRIGNSRRIGSFRSGSWDYCICSSLYLLKKISRPPYRACIIHIRGMCICQALPAFF